MFPVHININLGVVIITKETCTVLSDNNTDIFSNDIHSCKDEDYYIPDMYVCYNYSMDT